MTASHTPGVDLVTMTVGGAHLGIPVLDVRDVLDSPTIYPVPLAPREIVGSINLRGRIVTAIDLRRRFSLPDREPHQSCMCVIVESGNGEPYAFLVDEVGDVLSMPAHQYEPNPVTLSSEWSGLVRGLYRLQDSLLLVLDSQAALNIGEAAAERAA